MACDGAGRCRTDAQCSSGTHCETTSGTCVACLVDASCTGELHRCDVALHRCVECGVSTDCEQPRVCRPDTHVCAFTCGDGAACPSDMPRCDPTTTFCVACLVDPVCDPVEQHCSTP